MQKHTLRGASVSTFADDFTPFAKNAWNDDGRVGKPAQMSCGNAGVTGLPESANTVVYLDVPDDHPGVIQINPNIRFDQVDLDRLLAFAINREWSREEYESRRGILLLGPPGTGKTTFLEQRHAQRGIPVYSVTATPDLTASDLLQTREVAGGTTFWEAGVMLKAMEEGVPIIIHEGNLLAPAQLVALNEVIEKGRAILPESGDVVHARRGFMVHMTGNGRFTEGGVDGSSGTRSQNTSVESRFYVYVMPHATVEQDEAYLTERFPGLTPPLIKSMAKFAELTRKANSGNDGGVYLDIALDRRRLELWGEMMIGFSKLSKQIDLAPYTLGFNYTNSLPADQVEAVMQLLGVAFNDSAG